MSERRRGSGCLVAVVALIIALAAIGIIGDRATKSYVEKRVADTIQQELGTDAPPTVTVAGWPFLWQLWHREFGEATITADEITLSDDSRSVRINDINVDLYRVTTADDFSSAVLGQVDAAGLLTWDELSRQVGSGEVSGAGNGRIEILYTMVIFGQEIDVEASGRPVLDRASQQLLIEDVNLRVVGMDVPQRITEQLLRMRLGEIDLTLPMDLQITSLEVVDRGVAITVTGNNVSVPPN